MCEDQGFTYTSQGNNSALPFIGTFATYSGGGHVRDLNPFEVEVYVELANLKHKSWIDKRTRLVIVENVIMNANSKLISLVSVAFEFPSVGSIIVKQNMLTSRLYPYVYAWDFLILGLQVIFMLVSFIRCILFVYDVWKFKKKALTSPSIWATFVSISASIMAIVAYIMKIDRTIFVVEKIFNSAGK